MSYRLGLDLGTNSIGWAVFSLDTENEPENLIDLDSRIFSDGRDPKTKEPLAVERRTARGQRKILDRRKSRRKQSFRILQKNSLFPASKEESQALKSMNPYELRAKALDEKLKPFELGRALFNLSVRRGFKSNRKNPVEETKESSSSDSAEKLSQADKIAKLTQEIKKSNCRTLGEYLFKNADKNGGARFVPGRTQFYPVRQMYFEEFQKIKEKQSAYAEYENIDWDGIENAIFYQRPLKAQERGKCEYLEGEARTFRALPCSHKKRVLQETANLKFPDENGNLEDLNKEQRKKLCALLDSKEKITFKEMKKELGLNEEKKFNLESEARLFLKGNVTAVKMRKKEFFADLWDHLTLEEQDEIVETLIEADEDSEVLALLEKYKTALSDEQIKNIVENSAAKLESGTTNLSKKITELLVKEMSSNWNSEYEAIQVLKNFAADYGIKFTEQQIQKYNELPYYGKVLVGSTMGAKAQADESQPELKYGKISNPTVHVALNQLRVVVNALIKEYGTPTQISVELGRELKASREEKDKTKKMIAENTKKNEAANKIIRESYNIEYPNRDDRLKYSLWQELGKDEVSRKCLYCGKAIGAAELFTKAIEIEHILPFGRTLWDAKANKTVSHTSCNALKGERSPFEAFGNSPRGYNWAEIQARANSLKDGSKRACFSPDAMERFEKDSSFIARQVTDNAYLARAALKYLKSVCGDVWAVNGGMTKLLRDKWQIDSILKRKISAEEIAHFGLDEKKIGEYKKNRFDHRHHALDAFVIALTDRSLVKKISDMNKIGLRYRTEVPPLPILRSELIDKVKNIVVSHKPDHGAQGKLFKETHLGKIKKLTQVEIKEITESGIKNIADEEIRAEFQAKFNETKDIKKTQAALKAKYPSLKVFQEIFVCRKSLVSLEEKNIDDIIDEKIKSRIFDYVNEHKELKFKDAIAKFSQETGIKKARCKNHDQKPFAITSGKVPRYLATEDYFAAEIFEIPPAKKDANPTYKAVYIRRNELDKKGKHEAISPCPGAKYLGTVHKGDCLEFTDGGNLYKCRVAGLQAAQNKLDIRPICAVSNCKDWLISTAENMTEPCWKPNPTQNFIAVNVLFGEKKARFITVNPIGKVKRK